MEKTNKLIAEFMGVDQVDIDTWLETNSNLKYHTSWDWLIPVIKKCRTIQVEGSQRRIDDINFTFFTLDLLGAWHNVVEFIKWYERKPIVTTF